MELLKGRFGILLCKRRLGVAGGGGGGGMTGIER